MNQNTTTATLTQNDLNHLVREEMDVLRYGDVKRLAEINDLSFEDALFAADEALESEYARDLLDILLDEEDI